MSDTQTAPHERTDSDLPGAPIITRIGRLASTAVIAGTAYAMFTQATKGYCAGGTDGTGGYVDASGAATDIAPQCYELTMHASPLNLIAIALIVVLAIGRVLKAETVAGALRTLDRARYLIIAIAGVSLVVAQVWFWLIPLDSVESGSYTVFYPAPFAMVNLETTPMVTP
ncbi:hypothetical protein AAIB33_01495 [Microbacterium sp. AZCO]|uniref:hypothetical protein n=1 Tax=Microbacterium sp. AZCO TaxID=3142976 RepID=UPI0031F3EF89